MGVDSNIVPINPLPKSNRAQVGPGIGMIILGISYLWWWLMPWAWESYSMDARWAHNWAYSIIILTVGLSWYQKSLLTRLIALFQSFMMPITASGSINTIICAYITLGLLLLWILVVLLERHNHKYFFENKFEYATKSWLLLHSLIFEWILVGHMGLVFFVVRAPFENQLLNIEKMYAVRVGFLENLPPELLEYATWSYDISLTIWMVLIIYEQFKMGFNDDNLPWPRYSFWWIIFGLIGIPFIALAIQFS